MNPWESYLVNKTADWDLSDRVVISIMFDSKLDFLGSYFTIKFTRRKFTYEFWNPIIISTKIIPYRRHKLRLYRIGDTIGYDIWFIECLIMVLLIWTSNDVSQYGCFYIDFWLEAATWKFSSSDRIICRLCRFELELELKF